MMRGRRVLSTAVASGIGAILSIAVGGAPDKPAATPGAGKPVFSPAQPARPPVYRVRRSGAVAGVAAQARPDLVVLDPEKGNWVPASASGPGGYQVLWRVKNRGAARADRPTKLRLTCESANLSLSVPDYTQDDANICGSFRQYTFVDPLDPAKSSPPFVTLLRFGYNPPCFMSHASVTARADADGVLLESNEDNNALVVEFCQ